MIPFRENDATLRPVSRLTKWLGGARKQCPATDRYGEIVVLDQMFLLHHTLSKACHPELVLSDPIPRLLLLLLPASNLIERQIASGVGLSVVQRPFDQDLISRTQFAEGWVLG